MEYIDKSHFLNREQEIDRNFLKDCYDEDSQSFYPKIDSDQSYSNFSSRIYRKRYRWLGTSAIERTKRKMLLLYEKTPCWSFKHRTRNPKKYSNQRTNGRVC